MGKTKEPHPVHTVKKGIKLSRVRRRIRAYVRLMARCDVYPDMLDRFDVQHELQVLVQRIPAAMLPIV